MKWLKRPLETPDTHAKLHSETEDIVRIIIERVKNGGDKVLLELTEKYDSVKQEKVRVEASEVKAAYGQVDKKTLETVEKAAENITYFASRQLSSLRPLECEMTPGVILGHKLVPLASVGCYIPAGRYPLPSSALMSIIPAKVAGVKRIMACAPPSRDYGTVHPLVLVAMDIAGADEIYSMGGAQAIAAYRFGTETIVPADIIVGPGNKFVVEAKRQLSGGVGIDLLAGPSEVLIIADHSADKKKVAIDLLAKCEHDPEAVSVLVTTSDVLGREVVEEVERELVGLRTGEIARKSWENHGEVIIVDSCLEAVRMANERAPEHLQLMTENDDDLIQDLYNYGSLFIGEHSPVAFGDYCSGTNHTLPTNRSAKFSHGLWVGTFIKVLSYQKVSAEGAGHLARICSHLAEKEGLFAHQLSSDLRK